MSARHSSTMIKLTEQFPSGLPSNLRPIWIESYIVIVPSESIWQEQNEMNESIMARASITASVVVPENNNSHGESAPQDRGTQHLKHPNSASPTRRLTIRSQQDVSNSKPWTHEQEKQVKAVSQLNETLGLMKQSARAAWEKGDWTEVLSLLEKYSDIKSYVYGKGHSESVQAKTFHVIMMSNYASELSIKGDLTRAFAVFKNVETMTSDIEVEKSKVFLYSILYNNLANYFYKRKKWNVAARYAKDAYKNWRKMNTVQHTLYFLLKCGTASCLAGKYQDADDFLSNGLLVRAELENLVGKGDLPLHEMSMKLPPSFTMTAQEIVICIDAISQFNVAVVHAANRQYLKAEKQCQKCIDLFVEVFDPAHPWLKHVRKAYDLLLQKTQRLSFDNFKIKSDIHVHRGYFNSMARPVRDSMIQSLSEKEKVSLVSTVDSNQHNNSLSRHKRLQFIFPFLKNETVTSLFTPDKSSGTSKNEGGTKRVGERKSSVSTALNDARSGVLNTQKTKNVKNTIILPPVVSPIQSPSSQSRIEMNTTKENEGHLQGQKKAQEQTEVEKELFNKSATVIQKSYRRRLARKDVTKVSKEMEESKDKAVITNKDSMDHLQ